MKRWISYVLVVVLIFMAIGCGNGEKEISETKNENFEDIDVENNSFEKEYGEKSEANNKGNIQDAGFYELSSSYHFANHFREIEYSHIITSYEGTTRSNDYSYTLVDEKTINGEQAYQIRFSQLTNGEESVIEYWVDESNEILEASIDGVVVESANLPMVNVTLTAFLTPVMMFSIWEAVVSDPQVQQLGGWEILNEGTKTKDLGEGDVKIEFFDMIAEEQSGYFEVAELEGRRLFVNYKTTSEQDNTYEFVITRLLQK